MWSYYGAKTSIVDYYPKPKFDKIIEPFAGTARYALKYFDRDVLLVDKYDVIVKIWRWLQLSGRPLTINSRCRSSPFYLYKFNLIVIVVDMQECDFTAAPCTMYQH